MPLAFFVAGALCCLNSGQKLLFFATNTSNNNVILEFFFYTVTLERLIQFYSEGMMNPFNLIQLEVQLNEEFFLLSELRNFCQQKNFHFSIAEAITKAM